MRALLLALSLGVSAAASAQTYVDPVNGIDKVGGGSSTAPFKTLTFAVTQVPAAGPATFYLRPGAYSPSSGEVWPISLPDACTVESDPALAVQGARLAQFQTTPINQTLFEIRPRGAGNVTLRNLRITGNMVQGVHVAPRATATVCVLLVEDCLIAQQNCVEVDHNVTLQAPMLLTVRRCRLTGVVSCINVHAGATSRASVNLHVERSTLVDGIVGNVVLDAAAQSTIRATIRASYLRSPVRFGVLAASASGGVVSTRIEHCLLYDIGNRVIGGGITNGAIFDQLATGGVAPTHRIVNSVFLKNKTDAALGTGANYSWGNNLVQQANLGTLGGNKVGVQTYADRGGNDFHLAPTSLGIDGGLAADTTLGDDYDAEPRLSVHAGKAPDLGPDELFLGATFSNDAARPGDTYTLRTSWGPSVPFALFLGTARVPQSFGPGGIHLAGSIFGLGLAGVCGATGIGEVNLPVPNDPKLVGLEFYWQAVGTTPPFLGANAKRTLVVQ
ncbi:MAG: DUF1565 domain-containing protein [Planctomycetota bacterium]